MDEEPRLMTVEEMGQGLGNSIKAAFDSFFDKRVKPLEDRITELEKQVEELKKQLSKKGDE